MEDDASELLSLVPASTPMTPHVPAATPVTVGNSGEESMSGEGKAEENPASTGSSTTIIENSGQVSHSLGDDAIEDAPASTEPLDASSRTDTAQTGIDEGDHTLTRREANATDEEEPPQSAPVPKSTKITMEGFDFPDDDEEAQPLYTGPLKYAGKSRMESDAEISVVNFEAEDPSIESDAEDSRIGFNTQTEDNSIEYPTEAGPSDQAALSTGSTEDDGFCCSQCFLADLADYSKRHKCHFEIEHDRRKALGGPKRNSDTDGKSPEKYYRQRGSGGKSSVCREHLLEKDPDAANSQTDLAKKEGQNTYAVASETPLSPSASDDTALKEGVGINTAHGTSLREEIYATAGSHEASDETAAAFVDGEVHNQASTGNQTKADGEGAGSSIRDTDDGSEESSAFDEDPSALDETPAAFRNDNGGSDGLSSGSSSSSDDSDSDRESDANADRPKRCPKREYKRLFAACKRELRETQEGFNETYDRWQEADEMFRGARIQNQGLQSERAQFFQHLSMASGRQIESYKDAAKAFEELRRSIPDRCVRVESLHNTIRERDTLRSENGQLHTRNNFLRSETHGLQSENTELQWELARVQQLLAESESKHHTVAEKAQDKPQSGSTLHMETGRSEIENDKSDGKEADSPSKEAEQSDHNSFPDDSGRYDDNQRETSDVNKDSACDESVTRHQQTLDDQRKTIGDQTRTIADQDNTIGSQRKELEDDAKDFAKRLDEASRENEADKDRANRAKASLAEMTEKHDDLASKVEDLENELKAAKQDLTDAEDEIKEGRDALTNPEHANAHLGQAIKGLEEELKSLKIASKDGGDRDEDKTYHAKRIQDLEQTVADLRRDNSNLQQRASDSEQLVSDLYKEVTELKAKAGGGERNHGPHDWDQLLRGIDETLAQGSNDHAGNGFADFVPEAGNPYDQQARTDDVVGWSPLPSSGFLPPPANGEPMTQFTGASGETMEDIMGFWQPKWLQDASLTDQGEGDNQPAQGAGESTAQEAPDFMADPVFTGEDEAGNQAAGEIVEEPDDRGLSDILTELKLTGQQPRMNRSTNSASSFNTIAAGSSFGDAGPAQVPSAAAGSTVRIDETLDTSASTGVTSEDVVQNMDASSKIDRSSAVDTPKPHQNCDELKNELATLQGHYGYLEDQLKTLQQKHTILHKEKEDEKKAGESRLANINKIRNERIAKQDATIKTLRDENASLQEEMDNIKGSHIDKRVLNHHQDKLDESHNTIEELRGDVTQLSEELEARNKEHSKLEDVFDGFRKDAKDAVSKSDEKEKALKEEVERIKGFNHTLQFKLPCDEATTQHQAQLTKRQSAIDELEKEKADLKGELAGEKMQTAFLIQTGDWQFKTIQKQQTDISELKAEMSQHEDTITKQAADISEFQETLKQTQDQTADAVTEHQTELARRDSTITRLRDANSSVYHQLQNQIDERNRRLTAFSENTQTLHDRLGSKNGHEEYWKKRILVQAARSESGQEPTQETRRDAGTESIKETRSGIKQETRQERIQRRVDSMRAGRLPVRDRLAQKYAWIAV